MRDQLYGYWVKYKGKIYNYFNNQYIYTVSPPSYKKTPPRKKHSIIDFPLSPELNQVAGDDHVFCIKLQKHRLHTLFINI